MIDVYTNIYIYKMFVCLSVSLCLFPPIHLGPKAPKLGRRPQNWGKGPKSGPKAPKLGRRPQIWVKDLKTGPKSPKLGRRHSLGVIGPNTYVILHVFLILF